MVHLSKGLKERNESFEFRLKFEKSSFLRMQESSPFKIFWIPAFAGMTKESRYSKLSGWSERLFPDHRPAEI
jgi:hypothetical protein